MAPQEGLDIFIWHAHDGLSDPKRVRRMVDFLVNRKADVIFVPEACPAGQAASLEAVREDFDKHYVTLHEPYNDDDERPDQHEFFVAAKKEINPHLVPVSMAGRTAIHMAFEHERFGVIRGYGVHIDDGTQERRNAQLEALLDLESEPAGGEDAQIVPPAASLAPVDFIGGTLYAMRRGDWRAVAARGFGKALQWLPAGTPVPGRKIPLLKRPGSYIARSAAMASGETAELLNAAGFYDADPSHTATIRYKGIPVFPLDQLMLREGRLEALDVCIGEAPADLSNHRSVSARLVRTAA